MTNFHWRRDSKRDSTLLFTNADGEFGRVWETLYQGWVGEVYVNGVTTRLNPTETESTARMLVENYWEAAWALKL